MESWPTWGEALARRRLRKETRAGVDHFAMGQHGAFRLASEPEIAYLSYVNGMGHVMLVPCVRDAEGAWVPMGLYQEAAFSFAGPLRQLPPSRPSASAPKSPAPDTTGTSIR